MQGAFSDSQKWMAVIKQRAGYAWLVMKGDLDILWGIALLLQFCVSLKSFLETELWKRMGTKILCIRSLCEECWDLL